MKKVKQIDISAGMKVSELVGEMGGSGAELREGISWEKMSGEGKFTEVYCDATIALPLIWAAVKDRLNG